MKNLTTSIICSESAASLLISLGCDPKELKPPPSDLHVGDVITLEGINEVAFVVTKRWLSVGHDSDNLYFFVERSPFPI